MNTTQNYALIDKESGYVWFVGEAESPEAVCAKAALETGGQIANYQLNNGNARTFGKSGFFVYEAPAGFDVDDGQDQDQIDKVSALPLIGHYEQAIEVAETMLMNPDTGSVDTADNWAAEGYTPENSRLVAVVKDKNGDWTEAE